MTDYIEVKPLRTFDNGSGLKTVDSDPFPVERGEANALKALGLVQFEDDAEPVAVPESAEPAEPISSAPRGEEEGKGQC
ncbi:hypothetical protein AAIH70_11680 [Neorhizobium sp. BT27B]|uniref:hypothetical protein n=1 Tax=Neorhizobium sp. BT27B TaxID=3142625 RepID=UPI003D279CA1